MGTLSTPAITRGIRLRGWDRWQTPPDQLIPRSAGAEILLTHKTPLDAAAIGSLPRLRFIAVTATGYNVLDVAAAKARRIAVSNVPEYGTDTVAQLVIALLLEWCQHVALHDAAVKAGEWSRNPDRCFWKRPLIELTGKRMRIIGFGRIGRRVRSFADALAQEGDSLRQGEADPPTYTPFRWASIEEVFAEADVVTLHCPQTPETTGLVDARLLKLMKPQAFFINAARRTRDRVGSGGGAEC